MLGIDDLRRCRADWQAENPVDADLHQRHADDQNDGSRHHWRKQLQHTADERRDKNGDDAGANDGAKYHASAFNTWVCNGHRDHRADRGEGNAHHDRKLDAKPLRGAKRLQDRGDAAHKQIRRNQERDVSRLKLQRPAHDKRHGNSASIHDKNMLQTERKQSRCRQDLVDGMQRLRHGFLLPSRAVVGNRFHQSRR
jgi:hypothetical protein